MVSHAQLDQMRFEESESCRDAMRRSLRDVLADTLGQGSRVWVFGSLVRPGDFTEYSDIDVAVETSVKSLETHEVQAKISASLMREADVYWLEEMRIADRIRREGELWIL